MCICSATLAWECTQRVLKAQSMLEARQARGAGRPGRGKSQLLLESGEWAASPSGLISLSFLGDISTQGTKVQGCGLSSLRSLQHPSHPVGWLLPGRTVQAERVASSALPGSIGETQAKMQAAPGISLETCRASGDMVQQGLESLLPGWA